MRIQDTDRILKESRYARNARGSQENEREGALARVWKSLAALPNRMSEMLRKSG